jgi:hypothetical protein
MPVYVIVLVFSVCSIHFTMNTLLLVQWLYIQHMIKYSGHCKLYILIQWLEIGSLCTVYVVRCTLYTVRCTFWYMAGYSTVCAMYTLHFTLFTSPQVAIIQTYSCWLLYCWGECDLFNLQVPVCEPFFRFQYVNHSSDHRLSAARFLLHTWKWR